MNLFIFSGYIPPAGPNASSTSGGSYNLPYPTSGGSFPPYPPASGNSFGGFPPYPAPGNVMPATTSGPSSGYPPYMNYPPGAGYNSGYVNNFFNLFFRNTEL